MSEPVRYRFGPLEKRGLIAGWRGGQIGSVAGGLVVAVFALRGHPGAAGVAVALVAVCGTIAAACWPIRGQTAEQWLPVVVRYGTERGWRQHRSAAPGTGLPPPRLGHEGEAMFAGLAIIGARSSPGASSGTSSGASLGASSGSAGAGHEVGVVVDRRRRTYTAVMALRGNTFALLAADEKDRTVSRWSAMLADLAREGSVLHRVQWVASAIPDDGRAAERYISERAVLDSRSTARRSYADLFAQAGANACRHEVLLSVQVRATASSARAIKAAGGGDNGGCHVVLREASALRRRLGETDVAVERILGPEDLARIVRRSWIVGPPGLAGGDPATMVSVVDGGDPRSSRRPPAWPWPMAVDTQWAQVRTDETWHATYWIAEWPRVDVQADFLGPLLLGTTRRSLAMVMEPVSPSRAIRQVQQARTADVADAELRHRGGFLATARRTREAQTVERRETELADGHASFRYSGFVTVTATSQDELVQACDETEQAAGQCRLELRRLYGDQAGALCYTLPLGRGLA